MSLDLLDGVTAAPPEQVDRLVDLPAGVKGLSAWHEPAPYLQFERSIQMCWASSNQLRRSFQIVSSRKDAR